MENSNLSFYCIFVNSFDKYFKVRLSLLSERSLRAYEDKILKIEGYQIDNAIMKSDLIFSL